MFILSFTNGNLFLIVSLFLCCYLVLTFVFFVNNNIVFNLNVRKNVGSSFFIVNVGKNTLVKFILFLLLFINLFIYSHVGYMEGEFESIIRSFLLLFFSNFYVGYFLLGDFIFFSNNSNPVIINFVLFSLIFILILLTKPTWFISCLVLEALTFLFLSILIFYKHKVSNFQLFYILVSTCSTIFLISGIFFYFLNFSTASSLLLLSFFCFKAGVLPFGFWVYFYYQNMNLSCFFIYTTFFYLLLMACSVLIIITLSTELIISFYIKLVICLISLFISFVFNYKNSSIRGIFITSTWSTSMLLFLLIF